MEVSNLIIVQKENISTTPKGLEFVGNFKDYRRFKTILLEESCNYMIPFNKKGEVSVHHSSLSNLDKNMQVVMENAGTFETFKNLFNHKEDYINQYFAKDIRKMLGKHRNNKFFNWNPIKINVI